MMTSDFVDPYVDPETGILRNLVGATTYDELSQAEGEFPRLERVNCLNEGQLFFIQEAVLRIFAGFIVPYFKTFTIGQDAFARSKSARMLQDLNTSYHRLIFLKGLNGPIKNSKRITY